MERPPAAVVAPIVAGLVAAGLHLVRRAGCQPLADRVEVPARSRAPVGRSAPGKQRIGASGKGTPRSTPLTTPRTPRTEFPDTSTDAYLEVLAKSDAAASSKQVRPSKSSSIEQSADRLRVLSSKYKTQPTSESSQVPLSASTASGM